MKRSFGILVFVGLFLSVSSTFAQQTKESAISAYIQASKAKLPANVQQALGPGAKFGSEPAYENWLQEPSVEKLHQMGIPRTVKAGKGAERSPMENANRFSLEGFSFVIAEYKGNISELYIKKKGGRYKNLFHFDPCNKIYLIKPGEKMPIFLVIRVFNCGTPANWQETIYQMSKGGKLEEVGHLGGQTAMVRSVDIDNNLELELINSSALSHYPEELEKQLKALPGYQEPTGPVLSDNLVYKWNGEEWAKTAEFYERPEW